MTPVSTRQATQLSAKHRRRPRWLRVAGWWVEAGFVRSLWSLAAVMSPAGAAAFGRRLFRWLGPRSGKHRFVERNLALAFPDRTHRERTRLARKVWENFGMVVAEYPHLKAFCATDNPAAMEFRIDPLTREILDAQRPAIYVSAHMSNWELAAAAITATGVPLSVVYAPQGNPLLDRLLQQVRRSLGCEFIPKKNALRRLAREIRAGRSVGILPDQRIDSGAPVTFFGRPALTTTSPAWLALKLGCPLIPVQIERTADCRYQAIFHRPLHAQNAADPGTQILELTRTINELFESWIRHRPGQWLCMRRRWPAVEPE